jgi:hypothetical protein
VHPNVANVDVKREAENRFSLSIQPKSDLSIGDFRTDVRIKVVDAHGVVQPGVILPVAGSIQPEVRMLPARVFLGSHTLGNSISTEVLMQVPDGVLAVVEKVETESADVTVSPIEVDGVARGRAYRVTQRIRELGERSSVIRFFIAKHGQAGAPVKVELCYRGEHKSWFW